MKIYTMGFAKKTAEQFFELLKKNKIRRLIDIRLNNVSQLAGFTKKQDLPYLLKEIANVDYVHEPLLAPKQEIIDALKKHKGSWDDFEKGFLPLMKERKVEKALDKKMFKVPVVLLCSEPEPEHCHRRLVAEYLRSKWKDVEIIHL